MFPISTPIHQFTPSQRNGIPPDISLKEQRIKRSPWHTWVGELGDIHAVSNSTNVKMYSAD